jgi:hypothetical protein
MTDPARPSRGRFRTSTKWAHPSGPPVDRKMPVTLTEPTPASPLPDPLVELGNQPGSTMRPDTVTAHNRRIEVLLACLPRARYDSCWQAGSDDPRLSAALAARADRLAVSDRELLQREPRTDRVTSQAVDLIVAADVLAFVDDLPAALDALWAPTVAGSHLVVLHQARRPDDGHRSGPDLHAAIAIDAIDREAVRVITHSDRDFLLDVYEATS